MINIMAITRISKGQVVKVSNREIKATIMKANNWTSEDYKKHYDIFKNKLRNYESFERAHGATVEKQSPQELLYKQARAILREGEDYKPSLQMQRIQSFTSQSMSKSKKQEQLFKQGKEVISYKNVAAKYAKFTESRFEGLIKANKTAARIAEEIKDPVMREKALTDFANQMHAVIDKSGKVSTKTPFKVGASVGSGGYNENFDTTAYIK